jgi:surface antigen
MDTGSGGLQHANMFGFIRSVGEAQPHSIAVFSSSLVGGVGHVAWVDAVNGRQITITEMHPGTGATGYHTTGSTYSIRATSKISRG